MSEEPLSEREVAIGALQESLLIQSIETTINVIKTVCEDKGNKCYCGRFKDQILRTIGNRPDRRMNEDVIASIKVAYEILVELGEIVPETKEGGE